MMQKFSQYMLKLLGWKIVGSLPDEKKYIVIVAPHTSNWDLIICLLGRFAVGTKVHFLAKHPLFFFPLGNLLRAIGGAPVNRTKKSNLVEQVVALYKENDEFHLGLAPEGTRSPVKRWKEGFYHIACAAKIPIVMIGPDYSSKEIRICTPFWPTGAIENDFIAIIEFFRSIHGRYAKEIPDYTPKK